MGTTRPGGQGAGRGRPARSGSLATPGPSWLAWALVATWGLASLRLLLLVKDCRYPRPRDLATLGRQLGPLGKREEVKVGESCPRLWPSRSLGPVLAEKKNCTCSPRALSGPCPSLIPWGTAALLPSRCQCLSDPTVPDFPNQRCAKGSREAHPWPLWISAIVTWMGSHSFRAEPYTSLAQFTVSCAGRLCS